MSDRDSFSTVAGEIAEWQLAAQQLPLADLVTLVSTWQNSLARSLNDFNEICLTPEGDDQPSSEVMRAVGAVTRRATALAIFTLGIAHRAHMTAHHN